MDGHEAEIENLNGRESGKRKGWGHWNLEPVWMARELANERGRSVMITRYRRECTKTAGGFLVLDAAIWSTAISTLKYITRVLLTSGDGVCFTLPSSSRHRS